MARVGEFCAANVTRLMLSVVIFLGLVFGLGVWMFYSPGQTPIIHQPPQKITPVK